MRTMVETVARALTEQQMRTANELFKISDARRVRTDEQIAAFVDGGWRINEKDARVAIEAMRKPTEYMNEAGRDHNFDRYASPAWEAMIDAALNEEQPE